MALLGFYEDDEYLPEYGTIVIRQRHPTESLPNTLLHELATNALFGTVATAGDGWLHLQADDAFQTVRLEAHDVAPPLEPAEWEDVVELPFHSGSGVVAVDTLTGCDSDALLHLATRGFFRVRVARRAADGGEEGDVWSVWFWPVSGQPLPPCWLKRTRAAVQNPNSGWEQVLGRSVFEVLWSLTGRGPTGPDGWLDEPLPEPTESLRSACAQLGAALPTIRRGTTELLSAAGLLLDRDDGGYRLAENPPLVTDVVRLPTELARKIEADALRSRYIRLASDLTCVAAWQNPARVDGLAELLNIPGEEVEPLLRYAVSDELVRRDGDEITA